MVAVQNYLQYLSLVVHVDPYDVHYCINSPVTCKMYNRDMKHTSEVHETHVIF